MRAASTTVVINEIFNSNTGGNPNPAANEYVELYNISNVAINLSTYVIYNKNGSNSLSGIPNPVLQPGEFRAVSAAQLPGGDIGVGTIVSGVNIGLDTTADYVGIANTVPTDTAIDAVNWGTLNPGWVGYALFANEFIRDGAVTPPPPDNPRTLQRFPDGRDTNSVNDWFLLSASPGGASCDDPYEPDNNIASASAFSTGSGVKTHRICGTGDQDWFNINMNNQVNYTIIVSPTGGAWLPPCGGISNGNLLATGVPSGGGSRGSTLSNYQPGTSGNYFAQVTGNTGSPGADWLYTIVLSSSAGAATATPTVTPVAGCVDAYEPDNSIPLAKAILLNSEQGHIICPAADQDWVYADVGTNKVYHWYTKDLAGPLDTVMSLYDSDGHRLFTNDDYPGRGLGSQIDWTFTSAQRVYIRVVDKTNGGGNGFSYTLGFTADAGPLTPTATISATITPRPRAHPAGLPGCL